MRKPQALDGFHKAARGLRRYLAARFGDFLQLLFAGLGVFRILEQMARLRGIARSELAAGLTEQLHRAVHIPRPVFRLTAFHFLQDALKAQLQHLFIADHGVVFRNAAADGRPLALHLRVLLRHFALRLHVAEPCGARVPVVQIPVDLLLAEHAGAQDLPVARSVAAEELIAAVSKIVADNQLALLDNRRRAFYRARNPACDEHLVAALVLRQLQHALERIVLPLAADHAADGLIVNRVVFENFTSV